MTTKQTKQTTEDHEEMAKEEYKLAGEHYRKAAFHEKMAGGEAARPFYKRKTFWGGVAVGAYVMLKLRNCN